MHSEGSWWSDYLHNFLSGWSLRDLHFSWRQTRCVSQCDACHGWLLRLRVHKENQHSSTILHEKHSSLPRPWSWNPRGRSDRKANCIRIPKAPQKSRPCKKEKKKEQKHARQKKKQSKRKEKLAWVWSHFLSLERRRQKPCSSSHKIGSHSGLCQASTIKSSGNNECQAPRLLVPAQEAVSLLSCSIGPEWSGTEVALCCLVTSAQNTKYSNYSEDHYE